jgi:hypothetical protein
MWTCPKCREEVEDSFDVCWSCGTTIDGVEDPSFAAADESGPIPDGIGDEELEAIGPFADFGGTPIPDLVECYMASNTIEAKFIADKIDVNMVTGGIQPQMWGYGPKVRVRTEDLGRAQTWIKDYEQRRQSKQDDLG